MTDPVPISFFELWQPGYSPGTTITVYKAGTMNLADLFTDVGMTVPAANPHLLDYREYGGRSYVKVPEPLYTNEAFEVHVGGTHQTGVVRAPLVNLDGLDVSTATVKALGTSADRSLESIAADIVHTKQFGDFGPSASANTAILNNAIGAAAARGGGDVLLPNGTILFTQIQLSPGVRLVGEGADVTTLQSEVADRIVTLGGPNCGLVNLTLDGVSLQVNSVGVYAVGIDRSVMQDCIVRRFETNIYFKGGKHNHWRGLLSDNAVYGAKLHGDKDAGGQSQGGVFQSNSWEGTVSTCTDAGIEFKYEDERCENNELQCQFSNNTGDALRIDGARFTTCEESVWEGNTVDLQVKDGTEVSKNPDNQVIGVYITGFLIIGGEIRLDDKCQHVQFERGEIQGAAFTLTSVENVVLLKDVIEDAQVTVAGNLLKIGRITEQDKVIIVGQTTDATPTQAFNYTIEPGESVILLARIVARRRFGGSEFAGYFLQVAANRPGSDLAYDNQSGQFTVGDVLTGANSQATAVIRTDSVPALGDGVLQLIEIDKEFENNETITDPSGGNALANGTLQQKDAVLGFSTIDRSYEDAAGLLVAGAVTGPDVVVNVTGIAAQTYDWTLEVDIVKS